MNEEIDDNEFYHEDFTTASDWEIFVAHMEEIINQWKADDLKKSEIDGLWDVKSEKLVFVDCNFDILWYKKNRDEDSSQSSSDDSKTKHPLDKWHDFVLLDDPDGEHEDVCLAHWYGLDEFVVIKPTSDLAVTNNESKVKILLSSALVLINNISLDVPVFVQIREKWQQLYAGVYESNGIRTYFDIAHLKRGPHYCQYLTGVLDLFKTKIMSPCATEDVVLSFQACYLLEDFGRFIWKQDVISTDPETFFILPFGVTVEPINSVVVKAIWSGLAEHSVIDTESYSDFDPMKAHRWHVAVKLTQDPICLLGECLGEFHQILSDAATVYDHLGDYVVAHVPDSNPLDLLTEPSVPALSTLLTRAARTSLTRNRRSNPPLHENTLVPLLYFLFPDADESSGFPYCAEDVKEDNKAFRKIKLFASREEEFKGFKTCAEDSLVWRLAVVLAHALQSLGGLKALCHVWYEFVQEMRYRWEKSMLIPGLSSGDPDLRTCLLNQKLQMLNCCLERKITRETMKYTSAENSEGSDEEFFDATDDVDEERRKEKFSLWDKPVGRLSKFGETKLLKTGDPLYIPFTQDPVLKTEDQLEEYTDILLNLGSNQEASEIRARIMSASLLSDMESFKAANPGAVIEDFIRWYSPRDWLEESELDDYGQKKGRLSPRMQLENNIWLEMWQNAGPVPANRQKRLFDDTGEAEKVLRFLDFRSVGQIAELTIPILSQAAIYRLVDEIENLHSQLPEAGSRVTNLIKRGERISRDSAKFPAKRFEVFLLEVAALELQISQVNSLQYKLNPQGVDDEAVNQIVVDLVLGREVNLRDKDLSPIGCRLVALFTESQRLAHEHQDILQVKSAFEGPAFPVPVEREFVLRADCVRPSLYSARSPQVMRAISGKNEFRLVGAFSEDSAFF